MMKTLLTLPAFLLLFSIAGLTSADDSNANQAPVPSVSAVNSKTGQFSDTDLFSDSTEWKLVALRGEEQLDTIGATRAFIRFDAGKGRMGGNGGCNSFGGSLTVNDNTIHIDRIFSTKMYCADVQPHEDLFFRLLEKSDRWHLNDSQLELMKGDTLLLVFHKK